MPIIKKSGLPENKNVSEENEKPCTTPVTEVLITDKNKEPSSTSVINNKEVDSITLIDNNSETVNTDVNIDICSKNDKCVKTANDRGQKRKNTSKKESKPFKKIPPMRTPRTEVVERKGALLEAVSRF